MVRVLNRWRQQPHPDSYSAQTFAPCRCVLRWKSVREEKKLFLQFTFLDHQPLRSNPIVRSTLWRNTSLMVRNTGLLSSMTQQLGEMLISQSFECVECIHRFIWWGSWCQMHKNLNICWSNIIYPACLYLPHPFYRFGDRIDEGHL